MEKCPDCMAHYSGEHTCPPWLKELKRIYDSKHIVKVQVSIFSSDKGKSGKRQVLLYNKDRTIEAQFDANKTIIDKMDGDLKKFFYANYHKNGTIELLDEAPWQSW